MTFREDSSETFKEFTISIKDTIKSFDGCTKLDILRDKHNPNIFFTYSHWESEEHLNRYRGSDFFKTTWARTKQLFAGKPETWTVEEI